LCYGKKLSSVNEKLGKIFDAYKKFFQDDFDIVNGVFPWQFRDSQVPEIFLSDTDKRVMVEYHLKISHCIEELILLERDMANYVRYYSDIISSIKLELRDVEADDDNLVDPRVLYGYKSQRQEGLLFHTSQLNKGLQMFCNIISPDLLLGNQLIDLVVHTDLDSVETDTSESDTNEEDEFEKEVDLDLILATGTELMYDSMVSDCLLGCDESSSYAFLSPSYSQSSINGRNGSNACSVITLLVGYIFLKSSILFDCVILENLFPYFIGCMETGNILYNGVKSLTITEAESFMPDSLEFKIEKERNCFPLTLDVLIFDFLADIKKYEFVAIVVCQKTVCLMFTDSHIYLFDSHIHGDYGAVIHCLPKENLSHIRTKLDCKDENLIYACVIAIPDSKESM